MSNGPERLEQAIYHGEQYVKSTCKQLLADIHRKIYQAVKSKDAKLIHHYFEIINEIFPQIHTKVYNPQAMGGNFFKRFGAKLGISLEIVDGIVVHYEDHEVGVPCIKPDFDEVILLSGQWLHKSYDLKTKSASQMVVQEVRTILRDIMINMSSTEWKKPQFMFELERIIIQMV